MRNRTARIHRRARSYSSSIEKQRPLYPLPLLSDMSWAYLIVEEAPPPNYTCIALGSIRAPYLRQVCFTVYQ